MLAVIHWGPDPIIAHLGGFALRWYSLLFAVGFIVGFFMLRKQFVQDKVNLDILDSLLLYSVVGTILGARIGNCLFYEFEYFSQHPAEILLPFKFSPEFEFTGFRGLASHGAMLGLIIAYWILSKRTGKPILWFLDRAALISGICLASIRLGNFMNSEILGAPFDGAWAVVFDKLPPPTGTTPRHPVQLYGFIVYMGLFIFMNWYYAKKRNTVKDGHIFAVGLTILGTLRFCMEFIKEHYVFDPDSIINMAQLLSLPMIIGGIILAYYTRQQPTQSPILDE